MICKAVKPAGQGNYDELERLYDVCHCTNNLAVILFDNNIIRLVRIFAPYGLDITSKRAVAVMSRDGFMLWSKSSPKAFRSGKFFSIRKKTIEVPVGSHAAEQSFSITARDGVLHGPGIWFDEETAEHTIYSEEHDMTISVLLLDDIGKDL